MRRMFRFLAPLVVTVTMLSACSSAENAFNESIPIRNAGQAAFVGAGLEVVKIKVERRLDVTCNPLNLLSDGTYCVSNYKPTDRQEVWCFKTLGGVDCYGEPDPYSLAGRQLPSQPRPLADPRMPMTPPGRHTPQVAVAPVGAEPAASEPAGEPPAAMPEEPPAPATGAIQTPK